MGAMRAEQMASYVTYEEWEAMDESIRCELLDGVIYDMAAPSTRHQKVLTEIFGQLFIYLRGKRCEVYPAPFAVRLDKAKDIVFQPDITVICDRDKLTDTGCEGAPDLVIEIPSPSTARRDRIEKFNEYMIAGVKEYWIVDPIDESVAVHILDNGNGKYYTKYYDSTSHIPVSILEDLSIDMTQVFEEEV